MRKHTKLVPHVTCPYPGCGRAMYQLNVTDSQVVYGCTQGHIHKVARPVTQRNNEPPNSAA
jgi:hypothetical protein